jgi:MerR family transcriptional regulator, copper efflux regulator
MTTRHLPLAAIPEPPSTPNQGPAVVREEDLLQVGDLAKASGKTVRAIHLYEELGLLKAHERSKGRYRLFTQDAVVRVRWISKLQSLGLSLSEIQTLVREQEGSNSAQFAAQKLRGVYQAKLDETKKRIAELRELELELHQSLEFLSTCKTACESQAPVHSCPTCERHPEAETAPELVLGVHAS